MNEQQLSEYSRILKKISIINEDISTQIISSVFYLLRYAEKYNISLHNKDALERIMLNIKPLLESHNRTLDELAQTEMFFKNSEQISKKQRSDGFFHEELPDGDSPEPFKTANFCQIACLQSE